MYTIKTLNAISPAGLAKLPVNQFEVDNETTAPQGILVRSADMHDMPLPDSLLAIARAGAGDVGDTGYQHRSNYGCDHEGQTHPGSLERGVRHP